MEGEVRGDLTLPLSSTLTSCVSFHPSTHLSVSITFLPFFSRIFLSLSSLSISFPSVIIFHPIHPSTHLSVSFTFLPFFSRIFLSISFPQSSLLASPNFIILFPLGFPLHHHLIYCQVCKEREEVCFSFYCFCLGLSFSLLRLDILCTRLTFDPCTLWTFVCRSSLVNPSTLF